MTVILWPQVRIPNRYRPSNRDHSAHCVKVLIRLRLFSERRSERKLNFDVSNNIVSASCVRLHRTHNQTQLHDSLSVVFQCYGKLLSPVCPVLFAVTLTERSLNTVRSNL